jgi:hypothetical protein
MMDIMDSNNFADGALNRVDLNNLETIRTSNMDIQTEMWTARGPDAPED